MGPVNESTWRFRDVPELGILLAMRDVWRYSVWCDAVFPSYVLLCRMQVHAGAGGASGSRGTINETKRAISFQHDKTVARPLTIDGDEPIDQGRLQFAHISRLRVLDHAFVFLHVRLFSSDVQVVLFRHVHAGRVRSVKARSRRK